MAPRSTATGIAILLGLGAVPAVAGNILDHLQCFRIEDPLRLRGVLKIPPSGVAPGCAISRAKLFCGVAATE